MNNSQNISQALDQLKREIQKETSDLSTKETQLKSVGMEKETLGKNIQIKEAELKQKEIDVQKLKSEIQMGKVKIPELERRHRQLAVQLTI